MLVRYIAYALCTVCLISVCGVGASDNETDGEKAGRKRELDSAFEAESSSDDDDYNAKSKRKRSKKGRSARMSRQNFRLEESFFSAMQPVHPKSNINLFKNDLLFEKSLFIKALQRRGVNKKECDSLEWPPSYFTGFQYPDTARFPQSNFDSSMLALWSLPLDILIHIVSQIRDRSRIVQSVLLSRVSKDCYRVMAHCLKRLYPPAEVAEAIAELGAHAYTCDVEDVQLVGNYKASNLRPTERLAYSLSSTSAGLGILLYYDTYKDLLQEPLFTSVSGEPCNHFANQVMQVIMKQSKILERNAPLFSSFLRLCGGGADLGQDLGALSIKKHPLYFFPQNLLRSEIPALSVTGTNLHVFPMRYAGESSQWKYYRFKLVTLDVSHNALKFLYLKQYTTLENITASHNLLTHVTLPISAKSVLLDHNQLEDLNVTNCPTLEHLNCSHNPLESLTTGGRLKELVATDCKFKTFNKQGMRYLKRLELSRNQLQTLYVDNLGALKVLDVSQNPLEHTTLSQQHPGVLKAVNFSATALRSLPYDFLRSPTLRQAALASNRICWEEMETVGRPWFLQKQENGSQQFLDSLMVSGRDASNATFCKAMGVATNIGRVTILYDAADPSLPNSNNATQSSKQIEDFFLSKVQDWRASYELPPLPNGSIKAVMWDRTLPDLNGKPFFMPTQLQLPQAPRGVWNAAYLPAPLYMTNYAQQ